MIAVIRGTGSYIPPRVVENEELKNYIETNDTWIRERTGIERRHVVTDDTVAPMAVEAGKAALVPANGQLLAETKVEFNAGDSVFDVFRQILREEKIHFEYTDTQIYNSVYIEGIGNLYEFDCGPQSGWMYSVNGVYPGLGCSAYILTDCDVIVFSYTCDLGADLGAEFDNEE